MDELVEQLYQRDEQNYNDFVEDDNQSLFDENDQPKFTTPMDSSEGSAISKDPYGLTTNPPDNKRTRDQAEFSSPEESPAYKKLLEKYRRECELTSKTQVLYTDLKQQYNAIKNVVDDIQQDQTDGSL